ncbi:DUF6443 domain-containing protein [Muricauda sp. 2012CJ35-5]|uniref:DUF6443 domain-containing protein n=1 Tax=Flagellimonas spongiicola TaxID=2942208 RepID=A0ABT0PVL4_9FLAO|nr:DUF6443 domain-containing protein [Allomuricauda spongiicola]MCL6275433.1 DUF6443 domain-containing protein [Allomuricauda spongiicola]
MSNNNLNLIKKCLVAIVLLFCAVKVNAQYSISGPSSLTVGNSGFYTIQSNGASGTITNISWSTSSNGTINSSGTFGASITFNTAVLSFVDATVTNSFGQTFNVQDYSVSVNNPPPPNPGSPTITSKDCNRAVLTRSGTPPSNVRWYWQGKNDGFDTTKGFGATFVADEGSGDYYIRARNTTTGAWSSGSASVYVSLQDNTSMPTASDVTICENTSTFLTASVVSGATIKWYDSNDNFLFEGANYGTGVLTADKTYKVSATIDSCESAKRTVTVTVTPEIQSYTLTPSTQEVCSGASGQIVLNNSQPDVRYQLKRGSTDVGQDRTSNGGIITWSSDITPGATYHVVASYQGGICNPVTTNSVTVVEKVPMAATITSSAGTEDICPNTDLSLTITGLSNPVWSTGDIGTATNLFTPPVGTTTYTVDGQNECGVATTKQITLNVLPLIGNITVTGGPSSRCMGTGTDDYDAVLDNSASFTTTTFTWSINPANAVTSINANTGLVVWDPNYSGTATLTAQADNGCQTKDFDLPITVSSLFTFYADQDRDEYWEHTVQACTNPNPTVYVTQNEVTAGGDCNDNNSDLNPGSLWIKDADGDMHGPQSGFAYSCDPPDTSGAWVLFPDSSIAYPLDDCDDDDANVIAAQSWFFDGDDDNFALEGSVQNSCVNPGLGTADEDKYKSGPHSGIDCDDTDPLFKSGKWYADTDNDGFGDPTNYVVQCEKPAGLWVRNRDDLCPGLTDMENLCGLVQDNGPNYVYTRSYQTAATTQTPRFTSNADLIQNISYFDDLGRPSQQIGLEQAAEVSGVKKDLVSFSEYDGYGRVVNEWLPYAAATGTFGQQKSDPKQGVLDYYFKPKYQNTQNPFSEKEFENSPLNRVERQAAPGSDWAMDAGHEIEFSYQANGANEVRRFEVDLTNGTQLTLDENGSNEFYAPNQLRKNVTYDENHTTGKNHSVEEYSDKTGVIVLKRSYSDTDLNNNGAIDAGETEIAYDTYYVYDDYGNLTFVLPPKMDATTATLAAINTNLNGLGYQYIYDHRNRLIEKRLPGKDWEYIVYNRLDQPILTQDPNQRSKEATSDEWLFTKYDAYGRVVYTGKASSAEGQSRQSIQTEVDNLQQAWEHYQTTDANADFTEAVSIFYGNEAYPNNSLPGRLVDLVEVLTVNYYDKYDWVPQNFPAVPTAVFGTAIDNRTTGMPTGSRVKVLETSDWITTMTKYDSKARPIYVYSENTYLQTQDVVESNLDFVGRPLSVRSSHTKNSTTIVTIDNFTYDHTGRMLRQSQCIGDENLGYGCGGTPVDAIVVVDDPLVTQGVVATERIMITSPSSNQAVVVTGGVFKIDPNANVDGGNQELIVFNQFDEMGQLESKKVGGDSATDFNSAQGLQTVDYRYNVRGWLTDINDVTNTTPDKLFNYNIVYNGGVNPLYNGNISSTQWRTDNTDKGLKRYDYTYDALNRITSAISSDTNYNLDWVGYDKNGNIGKLKRKGHINALADQFGLMDDLTYSYSANQLQAVDDDSLASSTQGFVDRVEQTTEYYYDDNGNMTKDDNKGVTNITYNYLNLPTLVEVNNSDHTGTISYIYDATGTKLKKTLSAGTIGTTVTEYAGNYVYQNTQLQFKNHAEGYSRPNTAGDFEYIYQYKDHLGNVRLSYMDSNQLSSDPADLVIVEESHYYPFGLQQKGGINGGDIAMGNDVAQKWKFNGIELEESLGLNLYEMPLRNYDPMIARWTTIDPITHHSKSTYNGYENNPVYWADPSGAAVTVKTGKYKGKAAQNLFRKIQTELGGYQDPPKEGQKRITEVPLRSEMGQDSHTVTEYYHAGGVFGSKAGWYGSNEYARIIKPVAENLSRYIGGWDNGMMEIQGYYDTYLSFMSTRSTVDGFYDFLLSYGNGLKHGNNSRRAFARSGFTGEMNFSSPIFIGALSISRLALGSILTRPASYSSNLQFLAKGFSRSRGGNLTFQLGIRNKSSNFIIRLERGARSPIYNTGVGKSIFATHMNIQKVGRFNYHLYLNPGKWKYFYRWAQ